MPAPSEYVTGHSRDGTRIKLTEPELALYRLAVDAEVDDVELRLDAHSDPTLGALVASLERLGLATDQAYAGLLGPLAALSRPAGSPATAAGVRGADATETAAARDAARQEAGLTGVRDELRTELLGAVVGLGIDDIEFDEYAARAAGIKDLVAAYRNLGGELELEPIPPRIPPMLAAALNDLTAALGELSSDDFPPRLAPLVSVINNVDAAFEQATK